MAIRRGAAILLLAIAGGCLEFEAQWITAGYDAGRDRITLHIVYHGLRYSGGPPEKAHERFREALEGGEVCLADWPFHHKPKAPDEDQNGLSRFLSEHVRVRRVGLFLDHRGRLSGGQIVTIEKVSEFLRKLNDVILSAAIPAMLVDVCRAIEQRDDLRAFALALPRTERVRILLALEDERATVRLREELEALGRYPAARCRTCGCSGATGWSNGANREALRRDGGLGGTPTRIRT